MCYEWSQKGHQLWLLCKMDHNVTVFLNYINFYFFHMQLNQHVHAPILLCSIPESLNHPLVIILCVSSCCLENLLNND